MANVILFTDRSPAPYDYDKIGWNQRTYSFPAGAYKIAAHLRSHGFRVLVVPHCMNFTKNGLQQIVQNNSKDLLWVGISTTFLTSPSSKLKDFRKRWQESNDLIIDQDILFEHSPESQDNAHELVLGGQELNIFSRMLKEKYAVPLLIGGGWVTAIKNGNLHDLDDNCHIVSGTAEIYTEKFSRARLLESNARPPFVNERNDYDDVGFKISSMHWEPEDLISPDDWLPLEISRGCAFNCAFCDYDRKSTTDNYKDPTVIRNELIRNYNEFGVTRYMLLDDLYNDNKEKIRILYDKVWSKLPFDVEWSSYMRLDLIWADEPSAEILKASGAKLGSFGIETLHDKAGRSVGKGLGRSRIIETLHMLKDVWKDDVIINGLFIAGLPFEPRESLYQTLEWTKQTDLIHTYNWSPMWISPPAHKHMLNKMNEISKDYDKFGVVWLSENNWKNTEGLTFDEMDGFCVKANSNRPMGIEINFGTYPDIRSSGLGHTEIIDIIHGRLPQKRLLESRDALSNKINRRLNKLLKIQLT